MRIPIITCLGHESRALLSPISRSPNYLQINAKLIIENYKMANETSRAASFPFCLSARLYRMNFLCLCFMQILPLYLCFSSKAQPNSAMCSGDQTPSENVQFYTSLRPRNLFLSHCSTRGRRSRMQISTSALILVAANIKVPPTVGLS